MEEPGGWGEARVGEWAGQTGSEDYLRIFFFFFFTFILRKNGKVLKDFAQKDSSIRFVP